MTTMGIRVRDASGLITFDTSIRTLRTITAINVPVGTAGSLDTSLYDGKTGFFFVAYASSPDYGVVGMPYPTISGNTLSWTAGGIPCMLIMSMTS